MKTTPFDAGTVRLDLRWEDGRARAVAVRSQRPNIAARLCGLSADDAVRMLPLLYSICGAAQGVAARLALAAARGAVPEPAVDAAVLAEAQREHLWRLLLDWPETLGLPRQEALLVACRRRLQDDGTADAAALRTPFAAVERALRELPDAASVADVACLPPPTAAATLALWPRLDAAFAAAPTCGGRPAYTGAFCRHAAALGAGPGILACVKARMLDFEQPHGLGQASAATVAPGVGRAAVETARGLLLHEIVLDGNRVADYVIVAPTEWNFHPAGPLHAWLDGAAAASPQALRAAAARAVLALDPCVRSDISIAGDA